jgi:hypothetical protein
MVWYALGLAALISFGLACAAYRLSGARADLLSASLFLLTLWPMTGLITALISPPISMLLGPVMDALFASALLVSIRGRPEKWKLAILLILGFQAGLHVAYQANSAASWAIRPYIIELNISYGAQLFIIAAAGVRDVVLYLNRPDLRCDRVAKMPGRL